ncbi:MAG: PAS domain-containing sensor histidine kinase [Cytophagales bacterium]|nr:MAG: PAS domain-containing sensor histidine kinase [Cytophagales bacterium]
MNTIESDERIKLLENELRKFEVHYFPLLNSTTDMICSIDEKFNVVVLNQAYQKYIHELYNVSIDVGDNLFEKVNVDEKRVEYWKAIYQKVLQGEQITLIDERTVGTQKIVLEVNLFPVKQKTGQISGLSFFIKNITEQHRLEQRLQIQNDELQHINAELDRFVYSASHDLRSPLSSLLGLINLTRLEIENTDEVKSYLALMEKSIKKLDGFIRQITNHSRNIRLEITKNEINFKELIDEIWESMHFMELEKKIRKIIEIDQNTPFYSDEYRLNIILSNLISNSIKYIDRYKEDSYLKVLVKVTAEKTLIAIEDNGQGISKEHLPKIFDMFYRANQESEGSGLGLYIVKEIVEKLKGKIEIQSILGEGTIVNLTIPSL